MNKVFSTVMSLLCAFTMVFCLSGCNFTDVLGGGGGTSWYPPGGSIWGGDKDTGTEESNPEFEPGYFDETIEKFVGVRLMQQPAVGSLSGNAETDAERARFLSNVMEQYEALSAYIILRLVGEFGMGAEAPEGGDITYTTSGGDYSITVPLSTPDIRNSWIFDTNQFAIQRSVTGWQFAKNTEGEYIKDTEGNFLVQPIYNEQQSGGFAWIVRLENDYLSLSEQEYMQAYLNNALTYVQICLMQLDAGVSAMTYNEYNADYAGSILLDFANNYDRLGLVLTDTTENAAQLGAIYKGAISQFILERMIGVSTTNYNSGNKTFSEPFIDWNGDNKYDALLNEPIIPAESFIDWNGNDVYDPTLDEPFEDSNDNGEWDEGETFTDYNENGVRETGLAEPYTDANGNGVYDYETFTDYNENGVRDTNISEPFFDANENGQRDATITTGTWFVRNYSEVAGNIADELTVLTNEPSETPLFPQTWRLEVTDIAAADFFTPGIEATSDTVRRLSNMDYAQWQSALFVPKENYQFDMLSIDFDAETSFGLTVYIKVNTAAGSFVVPVCFMGLDHTKSSDWMNIQEGLYSETMDLTGDEFEEAYRRITLEDLFDKTAKRNSIMVEMDLIMDAIQLGIVRAGIAGYDGTLDLEDRGYHTNKVDNIELGNMYDKTLVSEGTEMLAYAGVLESFELLFEIDQPVEGQQYNFKFLVNGSLWGELGE